MQNILSGWSDIVQRGVYRVPYALETRLGMVDLEDVADVAAEVLTSGRHDGAIYELSGPDILDQFEVASILGDTLGKRVRAERVPSGEWERSARASGLDDERVGTLQQMFWYYEKYGFWGNPVVLDCLLGRPPTSLTVFIRRHAGGGVT